ncbi:MAG TPA: GSCFA domain-containing protein [Gaiellaceae bacterium]|jgi:hypothetical protein
MGIAVSDAGGRGRGQNKTWFRGENCNFHPPRPALSAQSAVATWILDGWLPDSPIINPTTQVTAFGSCFAQHIGEHLSRRKYSVLSKGDSNAYVVGMGEGIVNTFALRGQFDWAFEGIAPTTELWHGYNAEKFGYDEAVREATREIFERTDVFILTLGLSEVWYDEPTGEVFWRAVPRRNYDEARHKFRVTSVAENAANLRAIHATIRKYRPGAHIVLTLSPIPLFATFRPQSCITANSVSKAILRAAIDELYRDAQDPLLHYWPSYEIVVDAFGTGKWDDDGHHIKRPVLDYIMGLFESVYCTGLEPEQSLLELQVQAMEAAGDLPAEVLSAARTGATAQLKQWVDGRLAADQRESAELVLTYAELFSQDPGLFELRRATAARVADDEAARRAAAHQVYAARQAARLPNERPTPSVMSRLRSRMR